MATASLRARVRRPRAVSLTRACCPTPLPRAFSDTRAKGIGLLRGPRSNPILAEFETGLRTLGLDVSSNDIDILFQEWDRDRSGALSLQELTAVLHGASAINELRVLLAKGSQKVSVLFKSWDRDSNGNVSRKEFRRGLQGAGLVADLMMIDCLFESLDRDNSGSISFKELHHALRRNNAAEQAAKAVRRRPAAVLPNETAVEIADLQELRYEIDRDLRDVVRRVEVDDADMKNDIMGKKAPLDAAKRWRWAQRVVGEQNLKRQNHFEKESLHTRLRLRGTELEPRPDWDGPHGGLHTAEQKPSRAVTRHARLAPIASNTRAHEYVQPNLTDILSAHRRRMFPPARRHCRVLLPPALPEISARRSLGGLPHAQPAPVLCSSLRKGKRAEISFGETPWLQRKDREDCGHLERLASSTSLPVLSQARRHVES